MGSSLRVTVFSLHMLILNIFHTEILTSAALNNPNIMLLLVAIKALRQNYTDFASMSGKLFARMCVRC